MQKKHKVARALFSNDFNCSLNPSGFASWKNLLRCIPSMKPLHERNRTLKVLQQKTLSLISPLYGLLLDEML